MSRAKPGTCKFCDTAIIVNGKVNRRASWHPACALRWTIMSSPRDARRFVFLRDRGVCCDCGLDCAPDNAAEIVAKIMATPSGRAMGYDTMDLGNWELDHIIPLSQAAARGNPPELWMLSNMATRCEECHKIKTREDRLRYGVKDDD